MRELTAIEIDEVSGGASIGTVALGVGVCALAIGIVVAAGPALAAGAAMQGIMTITGATGVTLSGVGGVLVGTGLAEGES